MCVSCWSFASQTACLLQPTCANSRTLVPNLFSLPPSHPSGHPWSISRSQHSLRLLVLAEPLAATVTWLHVEGHLRIVTSVGYHSLTFVVEDVEDSYVRSCVPCWTELPCQSRDTTSISWANIAHSPLTPDLPLPRSLCQFSRRVNAVGSKFETTQNLR
jgi:hypothetical protein